MVGVNRCGMAATGRDVVTFVVGVAAAGLVPVIALPQLGLSSVLSVVSTTAPGFPIGEVLVIALVAMLGAAWIDTQSGTGPNVGEYDWE